MLLYEKYKKVANFNVMISAPKLSATEVHTDIIHLHFSAEGKGLLLVLDLEWVQGKNSQNKHQLSKKEKFFDAVKAFITKTKKPNFQQDRCPSFLPCVGITAF
jgi:hypothetical protein